MTATDHFLYFMDLCLQTFSERTFSNVPWTSLPNGKLRRSKLVRQTLPLAIISAGRSGLPRGVTQPSFVRGLRTVLFGWSGWICPFPVTTGQGSIKWYPNESFGFHPYSFLLPLSNSVTAALLLLEDEG